jgi:phosphate transport system protein
MKRHFEEELSSLKDEILKMAILTEEAIYNTIEALKEQDKEKAKVVIKADKRIDELELVIENRCMDLLALRQPMAIDLRFITTGMKINMELERIADLVVNIAERVIDISNNTIFKLLDDIPKLSKNTQKMVKNAIDAFVNENESLAKEVILSDKEADNLRNSIYAELINNYMPKDKKNIPLSVSLLLISRDLERICDHAVSISEDVVYMIQAKVVTHHHERL